MSTITLDKLIQEGKELKSNLLYERGSMGWSWYEWESDESQSLYTSWKNTCKRFLAVNFPNDISRNDFEGAIRAFEQDTSPQNFQEIIGVLQGL
ncbi:hypothetical protein [Porphyromonas sp. COT-239 OH1446]|uniref:hypothetical protein n=1 Tax=Porphyromonas sp. COT-239 OH1446 TaxID=1515613 RepID=UPI00052D0E62|nr:hypothetical protein [Porphyromonas sp. COT-239 OH1446]KGN71566.1 hypothetical protein HQ37_01490 [Porphyromonas sp. COT-239 OH1446]